MKQIAVLGSTGSIGTNTLRVVERFADRFRVVGLSAGRQTDRLMEQIARHRPRVVSLSADAPEEDRARVRSEFPEVRVLRGIEGMVEVATHPDSDFVMSATVGAVGLVPTLRAIEAGKTVAEVAWYVGSSPTVISKNYWQYTRAAQHHDWDSAQDD